MFVKISLDISQGDFVGIIADNRLEWAVCAFAAYDLGPTLMAKSRDGEIVVHGPNVMQGYHNKPEATRAIMTADGGVHTGDRGYLDEEGFLFITGRIKEQYKLENGKYVFPAAIAEPFSLNNSLLTQTMKLKREKVLERYQAEITRLYEDPTARGEQG